MRKRVWSLLLVCCMILTLCPLSAFANEDAESVMSKSVSERAEAPTYKANMGESEDFTVFTATEESAEDAIAHLTAADTRIPIGGYRTIHLSRHSKETWRSDWSWSVEGDAFRIVPGSSSELSCTIEGVKEGTATLIYRCTWHWEAYQLGTTLTQTRTVPEELRFSREVGGGPHPIWFVLNGGWPPPWFPFTDASMTTMVSLDEQYGELPEPIKPGYVFQGWFTDAEGGNQILPSTIVTANIDILYAHWEAATYTVQFDANSGSGQMDDLSNNQYFDTCTIPDNQFNKARCHFVCWNTRADGSGRTYQPGDTIRETEGIVTLYAIWKTDDNEIPYCAFFLDTPDYTYDGTEKTPAVTVKDALETLQEGRDYTISYRDNTNAGTATIILTGMGNYKGVVEWPFTIGKASQSATMTVTVGASTLHPDETTAIIAEGLGVITYRSSAPTVAQINHEGIITGIKAGTATITVSASGDRNHSMASKTVPITVERQEQTLRASIDKRSIYIDETATISATGVGTITYQSSDPSIARVDSNGKVTPLKSGSVTLTVRASGNLYYAPAEQQLTVTVPSIRWELDNDGHLTVHWMSPDVDWMNSVPWSYPWYSRREEITSVSFSDKITVIGTKMFWNYKNLKNVQIPDSICEIGNGAFFGCSALESVSLPDCVKTIDGNAFSNCTSLKEFIIPSKVSVLNFAVLSYTALERIVIPGSVATIGQSAFVGCENLKYVDIQHGVSAIESRAFCECPSLTTLTIPASVTKYIRATDIGDKNLQIVKVYSLGNIQNVAISAINAQACTGFAICPSVTVTDGDTVLTEGTDYKVTYANNIYPGKAKVSVVGMGNYAGVKTTTFTITANSIESANVEAIPDQLWCNAAWTPDVVVTLDSATLLKDRDYTVQYRDNTAPGTAGVTITGCNQYTGTLQTSFQIVKNTFTVAYLSHGGTGTMTDGAAIASEAFTLPECGFTPPDGQRFRVWNINGTEYAVGQAFTFVNDTEVIAVWEEIPKETYTVTYVSGGGAGNMNAGTATEKEPFMLPECGFTAPKGKRFKAWRIAGQEYAAGSPYQFTVDMTVIAVWEDISTDIQITKVSRNGNIVTADITCSSNSTMMFCAIYNNSGKMLSIRSAQITGESNYQFQFDGQQFDYAKAFILDGNFRPLCESKRTN